MTKRTLRNFVCCGLFLSELQWCDRDRSRKREKVHIIKQKDRPIQFSGTEGIKPAFPLWGQL